MTIMSRVIEGLNIFQAYIPREKQDVQAHTGYIISGLELRPSELTPEHRHKLEHDGWMWDEDKEYWSIGAW
jgi:hypothetical protein